MTKIMDMDLFSSKLRRLDLSKNKLTRLACFSGLKGLSMLNVSENDLQGDSSLDELRYLVELRTLNISGNPKITGLRSHVVKSLGKLQALIATSCGMSKLGFLQYCQELNTLILSKNEIETWQPSVVGQLPNLQKISLGFNKLNTIPDFRSCEALTEIRLNGNRINAIDNRFLEYAAGRIKTLDLSSNQLNEWSEVEKLTQLTNLTNLGIKGNPLPLPPVSASTLSETLKEDLALEKGRLEGEDEAKKLTRQYVLVQFQREVGKERKVKEQLIVLDQRRVKIKWTQGGANKGRESGKREREEDEGEWEVMSDQEERGKKGKKQRQKRRGKKPEVSELGRAEPQQNSVLSDTGAGARARPTASKGQAAASGPRGADMDSGVLQVEILKAKRGRDKDKEEECGEGKKKKKRRKDKADKDREKGGKEKNVEQVLAALTSQAKVGGVGAGGASAW